MDMHDMKRLATRLLATTALGGLLVAAPVALEIDAQSGVIAVAPAVALAKDGEDNSGSGSDNSGSGSGSGSDRDRDDDRSGSNSGSDDDDHDNSGHGSDDDDRDEDEDHAGRHGGNDDDDRGPKVEIFGDNIEITFADGTREEIENGVYERKNAAGRTVEERRATQADIDRLTAAASGGALDTATRDSNPGVVKTEVEGNSIEVTFADGTKEEIENGVYERKNAAGRTVEERRATQADIDRLTGISGGGASGGSAGGGTAPGGSAPTGEREFVLTDGTKIEVAGDAIEVKYGDGWKEEIEAGRYELKDPAGNTVVERPATAGDRTRLESQLPG